jgi:drug/metabolite transporter (DMT)-like permease
LNKARWIGFACGLTAAVFYGASFALTKYVQGDNIHPLILGSLIYFSQGFVFSAVRLFSPPPPERRLARTDVKWLAAVAIFGGCFGPVLYLFGQEMVPAYLAALLAPTEILFTSLIAVLFFRERLSGFEMLAVALIIVGAAGVGLKFEDSAAQQSLYVGALLLLASYLMWGVDNNCTTRIAQRDPLSIAIVKGWGGGLLSMVAGLSLGGAIPTDPKVLALIALLGTVSFGLSFVIFVLSMRYLGASRSAALFGTNPVFGVTLAWMWLREKPSAWALAGGAVILAGVYLMLWAGSRKAASTTAPPSGTEATPG